MKNFIFKYFFLTISLFIVNETSFAQLQNFTLNLTKTDETCTGNATLSFTTTGATSGSIIVYRIYQLPNITSPVAITSSNLFSGLVAGNYTVIATQTVGSLSNTAQQNITINNTVTTLVYNLTNVAVGCGDFSNLTATVVNGNPATYEIISGPVIVAPQVSNTFLNLPLGTYNVRVNDVCGDGIVQTFTIIKINNKNLSLTNFSPSCKLLDCDNLSGSFSISATTNSIRYPLTVEFTVLNPSGGLPTVINQTINSGSLTSLSIPLTVPYYYNINTYYKIKVVDACGYIYILEDFYKIKISLNLSLAETCIKSFSLNLCNFVAPYNVTFLSSPPGFAPSLYNPNHPGPFTTVSTSYQSTATNTIPNGNYTVKIVDACGRSDQQDITISDPEPLFKVFPDILTCGNSIIKIPRENFPKVVSVILTNASPTYPVALPYNVSFNIVGGIFQMSFSPGIYTFDVIDECGHPFTYIVNVYQIVTDVLKVTTDTSCTNPTGSIKLTTIQYYDDGIIPAVIFPKPLTQHITSVVITNAPSSFAFPLPYNANNTIIFPDAIEAFIPNLPVGNYTIAITNNCGVVKIINVIIAVTVSQSPPTVVFRVGCTSGFSSIKLKSSNGNFQTVIITAAPSTFQFPLPYNVSFNIATDGLFYMNSLPSGIYTFYTKDGCDVENTTQFNIQGYQVISDVNNVIENCGSFNLYLFNSTNSSNNSEYWLQKFNPLTGNWGHPLTGTPYLNNNIFAGSSLQLSNYGSTLNIAATGDFRILKVDYIYSNGSPILTICVNTIKTFTYTGELKILSAYSFPCVNGGNEVVVVANGVPPLDYKITAKNGIAFAINNGTSNIFSGLQPAIYNFRIQDQCGNIVNRLFDIQTLPQPEISPVNLCDGTNGQLSVQPFAFLNYEWWKGSATGTILSTTNVLNFSPFSNVTSPGTYYVRIFAPNTNSCVDRILSYTVPAINSPNAGLDGSLTLCGATNSVNLFTLLNGTYDTGGIWSETTNSGMLSGNSWLPLGISFGTYIFKYKVLGFCTTFDEALVVINLNPVTETPIITVNPEFCIDETISLNVQNIPNATYLWSGPNGFTSTLQNPTILNSSVQNSGTYTVKAFINGCDNESSKTILVKPFPSFDITQACIGGAFTVQVVPNSNSFDANVVTYNWTGPNGFTSSANPILLTAQPQGIYTVTVSNSNLCSKSVAVDIKSTFCEIPNVVTPSNPNPNNQSFDLTGYDVEKLEIFSRWGRLVYNSNDYVNQWHGQNNNGGSLPGGTYYYFISLKSGLEKHGWVFLAQ